MNLSYEQQKCQVCKDKKWRQLDTLISGIWDKTQQELNRKELILPLGECEFCGHVQMMSVYDKDMFDYLYFSDLREPSMFMIPKENEVSPYGQMIDFFKPYLIEHGNIADFGCGAGNIFKEIKKQTAPNVTLCGVDFKPAIDDPSIKTLAWNLNAEDEMPRDLWPNGIDLAISTHVLEHVINPVTFLQTIRKQLSEEGKVFIEVPDCSPNTDLSNIAFTNVVHGQHIHYFSLKTLDLIAQKAGFHIIKSLQLMTRSTPRVLLILEKSTSINASQKITENARTAVRQQLTQMRVQHELLATLLMRVINEKGKAGIWGVGGDTYLLLKNHPKIAQALADKKLELFDLELAGHTYLNANIRSSSLLPSIDMTVFMSPLFAPTREKMYLISRGWTADIVNPYLCCT
jgi:2-polyprenyl-3-methyl-5-hydroxy-6-metoxy-1,4-benzoquinol methylase